MTANDVYKDTYQAEFVMTRNNVVIERVQVETRVTDYDLANSTCPAVQTRIKMKDCIDEMVRQLKSKSMEI